MVADSEGAFAGMRTWRGLAPADRIAARRAQLIEAATELMATVGASEVSMRGVCRQAGLTERYFYENFPNLDALLTTVLETVVVAARDRLLEALTEAPLERDAMFEHVVAAFTDFLLEDRRRGRIMFVESQATPVLSKRGDELIALFTTPIAITIGGGDQRMPPPDHLDSMLNANAIFGALAYLYRPWLDGTFEVPRERFDRHAVRALTNLSLVRSADETAAQADSRSPRQ
ncbi:TetR/AcrR family transcriptional regulator [Nocardia farcinica]|uniref:Transcriptional repressor BetI n=1 Tax=Nocardia farcinica TaxID=37329 RepID=A0A449GZY5_NOCFR|nr:TetR/AcrR family transcriptional regulator [Nocardia farcinica]MBA4856060.1 TetR/AcrR family transcriptional regulator [Nocardia farcinica]MBC9816269.1 TetR/AcrR family transcriptional regulator [Nocardia farcinica]MBF6229673.1 TetR/AcrR family transcriptional regulator [Nocardia farcinica]MBF6359903.1 TetR/AcrR family transcriptional regulator [Nocardia farcinica]MBF6538473.1 TetR/AcrR family transcriptional regulator [Nocardia farcinica]